MSDVIDFNSRRQRAGIVTVERADLRHKRPWIYLAHPDRKGHRGWGVVYTMGPGRHGRTVSAGQARAQVRVGYEPPHDPVQSLASQRFGRGCTDMNRPGRWGLFAVVDGDRAEVASGDTLTHSDESHRRAAARALESAGWRVVLDGDEVQP